MKYLFLLLLVPAISFCQERATTESGKKVILNKNGTWEYLKSNAKNPGTKKTSPLEKKTSEDGQSYYLTQIVMIENGKGEKVPVTFSASVPKKEWDSFSKNSSDGESDYFNLVAGMLSLNAQYSLKNTLSFEPLSKQFFMFSDEVFISDFKMMGRNGYGNMVETSTLVKYNPNTNSE